MLPRLLARVRPSTLAATLRASVRRAGPAWAIGALSGIAVAGAVLLSVDEAQARSTYDSPYGYERTWNAAVRMVRVDLGFKVTEKDDATGYLLFDYRSHESGNKTSAGSLEVVRGQGADDPVRVVVQLPQMPRYHEQALVDALAAKMQKEYGEPPRKKRERPALPPPDAGTDGAPPPPPAP